MSRRPLFFDFIEWKSDGRIRKRSLGFRNEDAVDD